MHPHSDPLLSDEDRRTLLACARHSIFEAVSSLALTVPPPAIGHLAARRGAFVTLCRNGKLRGCIGRSDAAHSLAETVAQSAITAALSDPRFGPLRVEEMIDLEIEISVLSELRPARPQEIQLGIHGIAVSHAGSRGLLLPQVAVERDWSTVEFLDAACHKAGLDAGAWRDPEVRLFTFAAEVFSDASFTAKEEPAGIQI
jgi:AmmeMemoRadiSam system protein A